MVTSGDDRIGLSLLLCGSEQGAARFESKNKDHGCGWINLIARPLGAALRCLQLPRHELERLVVAVAAVEGAPKALVEHLGVGVGQASGSFDVVATVECHLGHEAEHAPAGGASEANRVGIEFAESVAG